MTAIRGKPKLVLHIGTFKTGSTTIQNFLNNNSLVLQKASVIPLTYENILEVFILSRKIYRDNLLDGEDYPHLKKEMEDDDLWSYDELIKVIRKKLFQKKNYSIIFSHEHFLDISLDRTRKRLESLKAIIEPYSDQYEIEIIVFFRRQDYFIESYYQQWFQPDYKVSFEEFLNMIAPFSDKSNDKMIVLNWNKHAGIIKELFGDAKISIISFDKAADIGLEQVFAKAAGISDFDLQKTKIANVRLNNFGLKIMDYTDRMSLDEGLLVRTILQDSGSVNTSRKGYEYLNSSQAERLMNYYNNSNRSLFKMNNNEMDKYLKIDDVDYCGEAPKDINESDIIYFLLQKLVEAKKEGYKLNKIEKLMSKNYEMIYKIYSIINKKKVK